MAGLPRDGEATFALSLRLTNRAARSAVQLLSDEAGDQLLEDADMRDEAALLLHRLFGNSRGGLYDFQMQNGGTGREGDLMVNLWLTPNGEDTDNAVALRRLKNWSLVLMGTSQPRRYDSGGTDFLVIDLVSLPPWSVASVEDAVPGRIAFDWDGRFASGIPAELQSGLRRLPVHRLQRNRVRLLLNDWGRFLEIRARIAEAGRFSLDYTGYRLDNAGHRARFQVKLPEDFDRTKVRQARGEDIHLDLTPEAERIARALVDGAGQQNGRDGPGESLGEIRRLQGSWLDVGLDSNIAARIRAGRRVLPKKGHLQYRAIGELAQVRRLRWGLESLLRGRATNGNLGDFLFDPNEAALPDAQQVVKLAPDELLQPHLNEGQLRAVAGTLSAPDLFLIQGPPGTGKTTVIAEICYQVAKRGGRTLVASQANLAVDNAMSKLVHDPSIRALRRGRASSVEEEGQPYLEDYVIGTWLEKVGADCRGDLAARTSRVNELSHLVQLAPAVEAFDAARLRYGTEIRDLRAAAADAALAYETKSQALSIAQAQREALQGQVACLDAVLAAYEDADEASLDVLWAKTCSGSTGAELVADSAQAVPAEADDTDSDVMGRDGSERGDVADTPADFGLTPGEGVRNLTRLEQAVALWTDAGAQTDAGEVAPARSETFSPRLFIDYVRRSWAVTEKVARLRAHASEAVPKIEALSLLCRSWYDLVAREQPLLERRQARLAVPAGRRARIAEIEAEIVQVGADQAAWR